MHRLVVLAASVTLLTGASCLIPARSSSLIDAYRTAACVTPTFAKGVHPPTRGWDTTITIASGSRATVEGAEKVWGRIVVWYESDALPVTAVKPGDYIYPSDVRLNDSRDRLYVKASGLAGGMSQQTWLYEYDLQARQQVRRQRVHPESLPPECPMPTK